MSFTIDRESGLVVVYLASGVSDETPVIERAPVIGWASQRRGEHFDSAAPVYYDEEEGIARAARGDVEYTVSSSGNANHAEAALRELHSRVRAKYLRIMDRYADGDSFSREDGSTLDALEERLNRH
ncbi:hypothetical protein [Gordonia sp. NPDC003376]